MKVICILLLIIGIAAAKPYDTVDYDKNDGMLDQFIEKIVNDENGTARPTIKTDKTTSSWKPHSTGTPRPTRRPRPSGGPHPTGKPDGFWKKFFHLLFVKSVEGVKPDEHPDLKYIQPGKELVKQLFNLKKEVLETFKPLIAIGKLMKEDHEAMMKRVHEAVSKNDIVEAEHIVGEYFIAIQRRFAMIAVEAKSQGLFEKPKDKEIDQIVKRGMHHVEHLDDASKYILEHFNQFRVSDGLLDKPFVELYVAMSQASVAANDIGQKAVKTTATAYMDLITRMVHYSVDHNDHDGAVHEAGASVLSFMRRGTKVKIALMRIYEPKKCYV